MATKAKSPKPYAWVLDKDPTQLHLDFADWIEDMTGLTDVDAKTVQACVLLRIPFQRSDENQANIAKRRAANAAREAEKAERRAAREAKKASEEAPAPKKAAAKKAPAKAPAKAKATAVSGKRPVRKTAARKTVAADFDQS